MKKNLFILVLWSLFLIEGTCGQGMTAVSLRAIGLSASVLSPYYGGGRIQEALSDPVTEEELKNVLAQLVAMNQQLEPYLQGKHFQLPQQILSKWKNLPLSSPQWVSKSRRLPEILAFFDHRMNLKTTAFQFFVVGNTLEDLSPLLLLLSRLMSEVLDFPDGVMISGQGEQVSFHEYWDRRLYPFLEKELLPLMRRLDLPPAFSLDRAEDWLLYPLMAHYSEHALYASRLERLIALSPRAFAIYLFLSGAHLRNGRFIPTDEEKFDTRTISLAVRLFPEIDWALQRGDVETARAYAHAIISAWLVWTMRFERDVSYETFLNALLEQAARAAKMPVLEVKMKVKALFEFFPELQTFIPGVAFLNFPALEALNFGEIRTFGEARISLWQALQGKAPFPEAYKTAVRQFDRPFKKPVDNFYLSALQENFYLFQRFVGFESTREGDMKKEVSFLVAG